MYFYTSLRLKCNAMLNIYSNHEQSINHTNSPSRLSLHHLRSLVADDTAILLSVLPSVSLLLLDGECVEAEAVVAEVNTTALSKDLPWAVLVDWACNQSAAPVQVTESLTVSWCLAAPAINDGTIWDGCGVGLSVFDCPVGVDVDLLSCDRVRIC